MAKARWHCGPVGWTMCGRNAYCTSSMLGLASLIQAIVGHCTHTSCTVLLVSLHAGDNANTPLDTSLGILRGYPACVECVSLGIGDLYETQFFRACTSKYVSMLVMLSSAIFSNS